MVKISLNSIILYGIGLIFVFGIITFLIGTIFIELKIDKLNKEFDSRPEIAVIIERRSFIADSLSKLYYSNLGILEAQNKLHSAELELAVKKGEIDFMQSIDSSRISDSIFFRTKMSLLLNWSSQLKQIEPPKPDYSETVELTSKREVYTRLSKGSMKLAALIFAVYYAGTFIWAFTSRFWERKQKSRKAKLTENQKEKNENGQFDLDWD